MAHSPYSKEVAPPPLEMIGDLVYSPGSDLPFGKRIRIGLHECTIYASAIEKGYLTGIRAHHAFLKDHKASAPITLDDKQFSMIIKHLLPKDLRPTWIVEKMSRIGIIMTQVVSMRMFKG